MTYFHIETPNIENFYDEINALTSFSFSQTISNKNAFSKNIGGVEVSMWEFRMD